MKAAPTGNGNAVVLDSCFVDIPSLETVAPYLQQLSVGAILGFAAGYALKKVGKMMALVIGIIFVVIQVLAYYGFVTINWVEVEERVNPVLEGERLNTLWQGLINVLTYNLVSAAAFIPAFLLGFRRG